MTDFLRKLAVFLQKHSEGVQVVRQLSSEDTIEPPEEEGGFSRALLVPEPDRKEFGVFEVPRSDEPTQFTHFIDGIQHSQLLYYQLTKHGVMPVVYGYVAAMVLERRNRELHPAPALTEAHEALYLPLKAFDASLFERAGIAVHDSLEARELVNDLVPDDAGACGGDGGACARPAGAQTRPALDRAAEARLRRLAAGGRLDCRLDERVGAATAGECGRRLQVAPHHLPGD
jgi:hypothetical protein